MRPALIDENGFKSFQREVYMLIRVHHDNLVSFIGYCLKPTLLICMEYVDGGTLEAFLELFDPANPPEIQIVMKILLGSTAGFCYLHAMEPLPILHRDIK